MDFQLNPDAAEFVPVSPIIPSRLIDRPIAGSPLKQTPIMDDIRLPSPQEFTEEANHRPHEVEGKEDMINSSNGDFITNNDANDFIDKPKLLFNLDESEISSTRAEFGDESTASFLTQADYSKNDGMDGSFTNSCIGICDNDSMMMSFGPGTFNPLSNPVDLNAVHDLSDTDLCDQNDETLPVESEQSEWQQDQNPFNKNDNRDVHSPDVHPELVHLISPDSDQPPHSVAFPDHHDNDLLGTSSPVSNDNNHTEEIHQQIDNVTSEVAAMNLKNEQLSEVHDDKTLPSVSDVNEQNDGSIINTPIQQPLSTDDLFLSPTQSAIVNIETEDHSSPGLQSNSSLEHCSDETAEISSPKHDEIQNNYEPIDLMSNEMEKLSSTNIDVKDNDDNVSEKICHTNVSHVEVFENPLSNNYLFHTEHESVPENDIDVNEDVKITFEDDEGPIFQQFDPPTGDPFSRALSPARDEEKTHEDIVECKSPVVQSQIPNSVDVSLKLSESLQEFTGLENQLTPLTNGNATEVEIKTPDVAICQPIVEEISEKLHDILSLNSSANEIDLKPNTDESIVATPQQQEIIESIASSAIAELPPPPPPPPAVVETIAAAKPKATVKSPLKIVSKTTTTKSTNKLSPTSPTKPLNSTSSRPASSPITKKTATSTITRSKPTEVSSKVPSNASKSPGTKSTVKPPLKTSSTATKPKSTTLKISSAINDKKSNVVVSATTNGEAKHPTAKLLPKSKTTTTTTITSVGSKPPVKSTTTSSMRSSTTLMSKSKPAVGSTTTKVTAKTSTGVTSSIGANARPKTAPATLGLTKSRVQTTATTTKSPVIDKQIKETANKQISSSRTSTTTTAASTRVSRTNNVSAASTTTTTTSARRTTTAPVKKSLPITRMTGKNATAVSKITTKSNNIKTKIQNGVCEVKESKIIAEATTTTTTTTATMIETITNEQDIPQKDTSPVEPTTDNQLLIAAD